MTIKWHMNQLLLAIELKSKNTNINKIISIINSIKSKKDKKWERFSNNLNITIKIIVTITIIFFL
jgi:hypothetical protein